MPEVWSPEEYRIYRDTGRKPHRDPAALSPADVEPGAGHEPQRANAFEALDAPADIQVISRRKRLCDTDAPVFKWVLDGIVDTGILKDDTPEFVNHIAFRRPEIAETEETEIIITW